MKTSAATALYVLAFTYLESARPEKASVLLQALDAVQPGHARTLLALAAAQLREGRTSEALRTLERIPLREGYRGAPVQLLRSQALCAAGRHTEAKAAMSEFLLLRTSHPSTQTRAQTV